MIQFIYSFIIAVYNGFLWIAALFNNKAKLLVNGRTNSRTKLSQNSFEGNWVWIHVASLGEFEQVVPLIELIRKETNFKTAVSFYSPSGYEKRKDSKLIDFPFYFLGDSTRNVSYCVKMIQPKLVLFVKYELWFNHLRYFKKMQIPYALISGRFRLNQFFIRFQAPFFVNALKGFSYVSVQNIESQKVLNRLNISADVTGDPRFDRCLKLASESFEDSKIYLFTAHEKVLVFGSVWPDDVSAIQHIFMADEHSKIILAPHEINRETILWLQNLGNKRGKTICYTTATKVDLLDARVLILDTIGKLAKTYRYAKLAYVGGAFKTGLHNILEPAAYGIPVLFGPKISKFPEALQMVNQGSGAVYGSTQMPIKKLLTDVMFYEEICKRQQDFIEVNKGASNRIYTKILPYLLSR